MSVIIETAAQATSAISKMESMMGSITAMSCDQIYDLYEQNLSLLKDLIKTPKKLMRKAAMLAAYPFQRATKMLDNYAKMIGDTLKAFMAGFSLGGIKKALQKMLDCPFIADSIIGKLIADALDALNKAQEALDLPAKILAQLKAAIVDRIKNAINSINNKIQGMINNVMGQYDALLKSFGVDKMLNFLKDIQTCIGSLCGMVKAIKPYIPDSITDVGEFIQEKINEKVQGLKKAGRNILDKTAAAPREAWNDMKGKYDQTLTSVQNDLAKFEKFPITTPRI